MTSRFRSIVDVHLILIRHGQILLSRRHNTGFGDGCYHLPSGHLEDGESVVAAVIREAEEETGVCILPADLTCVHVMHQRNPGGHSRIGFFFHARTWTGTPVNREPSKCSDLSWFPVTALPARLLDYPARALAAIATGDPFSLNGWP